VGLRSYFRAVCARRALLVVTLGLLLAAAGCGGGAPPAPASPAIEIAGTWWARTVDGESIDVHVNTAEIPWFEITGQTIKGSLGCNRGGADYVLDGTVVVASQLESQAQLCSIPDGSDVMVPTERILRELLTSSAGFEVSVDGDTMVWTGAGHDISFQAASGEPPPPTTTPPQEFDRLRCAPGEVVETRYPDDGINPDQLAKEVEPTTVRVEQGSPLQWWGYDTNGNVVVGVFLGDVPDPDYQIVVCSQ
jgi:heat shock protein HslJ